MADATYGDLDATYGSLTVTYDGELLTTPPPDPDPDPDPGPTDPSEEGIYGSEATSYGSLSVSYGFGAEGTEPLLFTFSPPSDGVGNPPVSLYPPEIRRNPLGFRLFRHYGNSPKAVNVYKCADGSYTTVQPIPAIVDHSTPPLSETVVHIYYGGTVSVVDQDEAQRLTNAGFTVTPVE